MLRDNAITLKGIAAWDGMYLNVECDSAKECVTSNQLLLLPIVLPASEKGHIFNFTTDVFHELTNVILGLLCLLETDVCMYVFLWRF